ncbi:MAG: GNAT family N-acetyltransferase [Pseudomonadota bacterium]|nr:GNAT family N-acetyltransferase [Gammaproteobacteria bacterium]MBU1558835.1 GNAT family N-acetyltransferase [Gammaproteobacteria bacterium]MBU1629207.1 GNAT family N-acetyltransferase [Gammaproteobacteria bacterium]MBU1926485.1 GNAT family N-acetyltransferase [Gammaproteobacteria bacterium]MBU2546013.1 GNAT family N-acetyltransferase [Gammaproteobacteria bacterium]
MSAELEFANLTEAEFHKLLQFSIREYAQNLFQYKECDTKTKATITAKKEILSYVPNGLHSMGHFIYKIVDQTKDMGYIWFSFYKREQHDPLQIFLAYIHIFPSFRRKGLGSKALQLMEKQVRKMGINKIVFYVFKDNQAAVDFYLKNGYQMLKETNGYGAKNQSSRCQMGKELEATKL